MANPVISRARRSTFLRKELAVAKMLLKKAKVTWGSQVSVRGWFHFSTRVDGRVIEDLYEIRIVFPEQYPGLWPVAYELQNRVTSQFHRNPDESLCLGSNLDLHRIYSRDKGFENFIKEMLTPFLAGHSFWKRYGVAPFGERAHGGDGVWQAYLDLYSEESLDTVLGAVEWALKNREERGHVVCPCVLKAKMRECGQSGCRLFAGLQLIQSMHPALLRQDLDALRSSLIRE